LLFPLLVSSVLSLSVVLVSLYLHFSCPGFFFFMAHACPLQIPRRKDPSGEAGLRFFLPASRFRSPFFRGIYLSHDAIIFPDYRWTLPSSLYFFPPDMSARAYVMSQLFPATVFYRSVLTFLVVETLHPQRGCRSCSIEKFLNTPSLLFGRGGPSAPWLTSIAGDRTFFLYSPLLLKFVLPVRLLFRTPTFN